MPTLNPNFSQSRIVLILLVTVGSLLNLSGQTVDLATSPQAMTLAPNEESSFFIELDNPNDLTLDGIQLYLNFDPVSIEVLEITEVFDWAFTLNQEIDNTNGRLSFSAGNLQNPPSSDLTLLKVKIRVKSTASPSSFDFEFDRNSPRKCEIAGGGFDLLNQSTSLTIQIIEECPNIRTISHSPIIDGVFTAANTIIMGDNLSVFNTVELNAQQSLIPQTLIMPTGTELRVTDNNCTASNL